MGGKCIPLRPNQSRSAASSSNIGSHDWWKQRFKDHLCIRYGLNVQLWTLVSYRLAGQVYPCCRHTATRSEFCDGTCKNPEIPSQESRIKRGVLLLSNTCLKFVCVATTDNFARLFQLGKYGERPAGAQDSCFWGTACMFASA